MQYWYNYMYTNDNTDNNVYTYICYACRVYCYTCQLYCYTKYYTYIYIYTHIHNYIYIYIYIYVYT